MEPSSLPKHIRRKEILDDSKTEKPSGPDGIVNVVSQDIIFPENHSFDAGSKYFISMGTTYKKIVILTNCPIAIAIYDTHFNNNTVNIIL